jgi:type I restriction enzyme S subunit
VSEGSLPQGWELALLSEIAEINPKAFRGLDDDATLVNFVPMRAVAPEGGGLTAPEVRPFGEVKKGYTSFVSGDVIMAKITPCMENGKTTAVPPLPHELSFGSTEFHVMRPELGVPSQWIAHFLLQHSVRRFAQRQMTGAVGQMRVPVSFLEELRLPVAPVDEQQRICDALDELLSDLDAGVEALKSAQAKLELYRASVLKAAVEGDLTSEWRKANPHAEPATALLQRILKERRRRWEQEQLRKFKEKGKTPPANWKSKYKEPIAPDTANLPPLPEGWCWTSLDALIMEGPQNGLYLPETAYSGDSPILRIDDFQQWWVRARTQLRKVSADAACIATYSLEENDLVINRVNSMTHLGKCLLVPGDMTGVFFESNMMRMKLSGNINLRLLSLYLRSTDGRSRLTKSAKWAVNQASINQQDVRRTPVPLASLEEQSIIADLLDAQMSEIEHTGESVKTRIESKRILVQAIFGRAFKGRLVRQDPSDEPASELLKRIAIKRDTGAKKPRAKQTRRPAKRRKQTQAA